MVEVKAIVQVWFILDLFLFGLVSDHTNNNDNWFFLNSLAVRK